MGWASLTIILLSISGAWALNSWDRSCMYAINATFVTTSGNFLATNWSSADPCSWTGVTCQGNRVTKLCITSGPGAFQGVHGPFHSCISNLTALSFIAVDGFSLAGGPIPTFANCSQLYSVQLTNAGLTGQLPDWSRLPIEYCYVNGNSLSGTLPPLPSVLQEINVFSMAIGGQLPPFPSTLTSFNAHGSQFSGPIPPSLSACTSLRYLFLHGNCQLTGTIPPISALTLLVNLYLDTNQLTGTIPDFGNMPYLVEVSLYDNMLNGTVPALTGLTTLKEISLFNNRLTGVIPALPSTIQHLDMCDNQLTGSVPNFSAMTSLLKIYLARNCLTGSVPAFSTSNNVYNIYLKDNMLSGTFPDVSGLTLQHLFLNNNNFTGPIPNLASQSLLTSTNFLSLAYNPWSCNNFVVKVDEPGLFCVTCPKVAGCSYSPLPELTATCASYQCALGMKPSGPATCVWPGYGNGTWAGLQCTNATCARPAVIAPVTIGNCSATPAAQGAACSLGCAPGYIVSNQTRGTCIPVYNDAVYDNLYITCTPLNCSAASLSANQALGDCTDARPTGSTCSLACAPYYAASGATQGTCAAALPGDQPVWTGQSVTCTAMTCPALGALGAGQLPGTCTPDAAQGSTCQLACSAQYDLDSFSYGTCSGINGTVAWRGMSIVCVPKATTGDATSTGTDAVISPPPSGGIGGYVGYIAGGAAVLVVIILVLVLVLCRRKKQAQPEDGSTMRLDTTDIVAKRMAKLLGDKQSSFLGSGLTADVYKVRLEDGTWAAIKKLKKSDQRSLEEFHREMNILSRLMDAQHPNVIQLRFVSRDSAVMCMELAEGGSLKSVISDGSGAARDKRLMLLEVARGMKFLHENGFVHNDLKPDNVLLGDGGVCKISDFGASRNAEDEGSRDGKSVVTDFLGTPQFCAPERFRIGERIDLRKADVYSFGVLGWALYAEKTPFTGEKVDTVVSRLNSMESLELEFKFPASTPDPMRDVLQRCFHRDPQSRPTFAEAVKSLDEMNFLTVPMQGNPVFSNTSTAQSSASDTLGDSMRSTDSSKPPKYSSTR